MSPRTSIVVLIAGVASCIVMDRCLSDEPKAAASPSLAPRIWNFDKAKAGQAPAGWKIGSTHPGKAHATWQVTADAAAPSKPNVLTIVKADNKGGTFNLAMIEDTKYRDLELTVRVRANTGNEDQGGGLIWRCKDENNYYICRANPLESNFRVYKVVDGKRIQLETAKIKMEVGKWYRLKTIMARGHITCFFDGKLMLEAKDDAMTDGGMIGLWTKADAASSFDDLAAHELHAAPEDEGSEAKAKESKKSPSGE